MFSRECWELGPVPLPKMWPSDQTSKFWGNAFLFRLRTFQHPSPHILTFILILVVIVTCWILYFPPPFFSSLYHTQLPFLEFFLPKQFIQHIQLVYFHPVAHNILYLVSVNSSRFVFVMSLWLLLFNQNVWFPFLGINIAPMTCRTMASW